VQKTKSKRSRPYIRNEEYVERYGLERQAERRERWRTRKAAQRAVRGARMTARQQRADVVVDLPVEEIRQAIAEQVCPWCGRGPFKMLAGHTQRAHGVDCDALREMAGLIKAASLCDSDYAARCSNENDSRWQPGGVLAESFAEREWWGPPLGRKQNLSSAGLAVMQERGRLLGLEFSSQLVNMKGLKHSEETKAKMRKKRSPEGCANIRAAAQARVQRFGSIRGRGWKHSEETKAKIRAAALRRGRAA
jgi:hypothetical protein